MNDKKQNCPYPGISATADGSETIVWVETHIGQGACSYPITPTTNMGVGFQMAVANGKRNCWGEKLFFIEPESEHSSCSASEGFALAGGRGTNFTSSQGLILMKEALLPIAGKRLPLVFHIGARTLTSQGLCIHAGHDDIMGVADCGWGMLFARNAQETQDLALISRRAAEASLTPFFNVQDGFITTHTIESVMLCEPEMMADYIGRPQEKLASLFDPAQPLMTGVVQNQDAYMKGKVAQRFFYDQVPGHLNEAFDEFFRLTGRRYNMVDGYHLEDAEFAIAGMGSVMDTAIDAVDWMRREKGWKVGLLNITAFRPFPAVEIVRALRNCHDIAVIERLDDPLAKDNPLTCQIKASFADAACGHAGFPGIKSIPRIFSGVFGLGSRDTRVGDLVAAVENMRSGGHRFFSLGISHETSLPRRVNPDVRPAGTFSMRGHSIGGYGSVTTNKVIASLTASIFGLFVQAFPKYGSEKKGLPTTYYLTASPRKIKQHCELKYVDIVALNNVNAFRATNPLYGLVPGGAIFLQSHHADEAEVWNHIPFQAREAILNDEIRVYYLDTVQIAREEAVSDDLVMRMQGIVLLGVFLRLAPFVRDKGISDEKLFDGVKKALTKYFGRRGEKVVEANLQAAIRGYSQVRQLDMHLLKEPQEAQDV